MMHVLRWVVLPSILSALVICVLIAACRWISRQSVRLGVLVALGLGLRLAAALALFWISYLHLPILSSLQNGPGFWRMALDSQGYYRVALYGAEQGLSTIPPDAGSRIYVVALAIWMTLTGTSVFGGVLLNLACFVAICLLVVSVLRGLPGVWFERAGTVTLATLSVSPMLLFVSTQVLKDSFFLLFAVILSAGVWLLTTPAVHAISPWKRLVPGMLVFGTGMFVTAGVRSYYPAIAIASYGLVLGSLLFHARTRWRVVLPAIVVSLVAAVGAISLGSDGSSAYTHMLGAVRSPSDVQRIVEFARGTFIESGGATNVGDLETPTLNEAKGQLPGTPTTVAGHVRAVAIGVATLFVPLTILRALSLVDASGTSVVQIFGDLDTVFFDLLLAATILLVWRLRRVAHPNTHYLLFSISLAVLLAGLMAYVVTNVGTLVRLRLMLAVPFWTLAFAFARLPGGLDPPPQSTDESVGVDRASRSSTT